MLEAEYGSSEPIGFMETKLIDGNGSQIEIPKCPKCHCLMLMLIGIKYYDWICTECPE